MKAAWLSETLVYNQKTTRPLTQKATSKTVVNEDMRTVYTKLYCQVGCYTYEI
jgi:hypothetical protein